MQNACSIITTIIFIVSMLTFPLHLIYQRRIILRGKELAALRLKIGWTIYGALVSIPIWLAALFFVAVGMMSALNSTVLGPLGWLILTGAVVFFGTLADNFSPWRAKIIRTDKGFVAPFVAAGWRRIYEFECEGDVFRLYVKYFGIKMPAPVFGFRADEGIKESIDKVLGGYVKKAPSLGKTPA